MVKHFNVIMAGVIAGIVALFTSWLGVSGTVIGSVLSSFLYQFFSSYSAEKYEERVVESGGWKIKRNRKQSPSYDSRDMASEMAPSKSKNIGSEMAPSKSKNIGSEMAPYKSKNIGSKIVYIFPLVVIALIELIFVFSGLHYKFSMLFGMLETAVSNNLFRFMGLGLIALGVYPLLRSTDIDRINGWIVLVAGIFVFLRGMVDFNDMTAQVYNMVLYRFDFILAVIVVLALAIVIVNVLRSSAGELFNRKSDSRVIHDNGFDNGRSPNYERPKARKIDTSFIKNKNADNRKSVNDSGNGYHNEQANGAPFKEDLPVYEEEIIYVNNPDDPDNPIKKRILKRVDSKSQGKSYDDYDDTYIVDELK